MRTPAAPNRSALAPLLFATALGLAGFAAGWLFRPGRVGPQASPPPSGEQHTTPSPAPVRSTASSEPTIAGRTPAGADVSQSVPARAKQRLAAWVAAGCPRGDPREITALLEVWSCAAPWEALEFLHTAPQFRGRTYAYRIPLAQIARSDVEAAKAWIQRELTDEGLRDNVTESLIRDLAAPAPAAALALARGFLSEYHHLWSEIVHTLARSDTREALSWFERFTPRERAERVDDLVRGWLATDAAAARAWCMAQLGQPHGDATLRALARHFAQTEPAQLQSILTLPGVSDDTRVLVARQIGESHPEIALEVLPHLPPDRAASVFNALFSSLFNEDPSEAVELGRSFLKPEQLRAWVRNQWSSWSRADQPAALAWVETVTDPALRHDLMLEIRGREVDRQPAAFLATINDRDHEPDTRQLVNRALDVLSFADPVAASHWATAHPTWVTSDQASRIAEALIARGGDQAVVWAKSLPAGPARDAAHERLVTFSTEIRDCDRYLALVDDIADPVAQTRTRFRVYQELRLRDADKAERWLASQPLPEDVRLSWVAIMQSDADALAEHPIRRIY